jgi:hypothetical protein
MFFYPMPRDTRRAVTWTVKVRLHNINMDYSKYYVVNAEAKQRFVDQVLQHVFGFLATLSNN